MAIYNERDIASTFDGDLIISSNGDIKLYDSYQSKKAVINFILRTDNGDYKPDARVGANLGEFIGRNLTRENLRQMEDTITANIARFAMSRGDFRADVIPLTANDLGVFVTVGGQYIDEDGNILENSPEVVSYVFPYLESDITPIH
ncbi:MAG: hypothetical protein D6710_01935 [Nitrospirae bacterium]|nr:MAG: hypothetical protein D6710_01935 [Nitrospirota bacterium]